MVLDVCLLYIYFLLVITNYNKIILKRTWLMAFKRPWRNCLAPWILISWRQLPFMRINMDLTFHFLLRCSDYLRFIRFKISQQFSIWTGKSSFSSEKKNNRTIIVVIISTIWIRTLPWTSRLFSKIDKQRIIKKT